MSIFKFMNYGDSSSNNNTGNQHPLSTLCEACAEDFVCIYFFNPHNSPYDSMKYCYSPHLTDREVEAQQGLATCPTAGERFRPSQLGPGGLNHCDCALYCFQTQISPKDRMSFHGDEPGEESSQAGKKLKAGSMGAARALREHSFPHSRIHLTDVYEAPCAA